MKLDKKRHEAAEKERRAIMQVMYSDPASEQEQIDLERQRLELAQLRADIAKTEAETAETANKFAMVIHKNAKSGIDAAEKNDQKLTKLAKSSLGRELKP